MVNYYVLKYGTLFRDSVHHKGNAKSFQKKKRILTGIHGETLRPQGFHPAGKGTGIANSRIEKT
jgi:hypothetical protein